MRNRSLPPSPPASWKNGAALALALLALQAVADAQVNTAQGQGFNFDWTTIQSTSQAYSIFQIVRILVTIFLGIMALKGAIGISMAWNALQSQRGEFPEFLKSMGGNLGLFLTPIILTTILWIVSPFSSAQSS